MKWSEPIKLRLITAVFAGLLAVQTAYADDCAVDKSMENVRETHELMQLYNITKIAEDMKTIRELLEASAVHPDKKADLLNRREADARKVDLVRYERAKKQGTAQ